MARPELRADIQIDGDVSRQGNPKNRKESRPALRRLLNAVLSPHSRTQHNPLTDQRLVYKVDKQTLPRGGNAFSMSTELPQGRTWPLSAPGLPSTGSHPALCLAPTPLLYCGALTSYRM